MRGSNIVLGLYAPVSRAVAVCFTDSSSGLVLAEMRKRETSQLILAPHLREGEHAGRTLDASLHPSLLAMDTGTTSRGEVGATSHAVEFEYSCNSN